VRWVIGISSSLLLAIAVGGTNAANAACSNPTGAKAEIIYNSVGDTRIMQYCDDVNWIAMVGNSECTNVGETCSDGSVYAGLSPDGNVPMYTTPGDAGTFTWNDGSGTWVDTAMQNCATTEASCRTGAANTTLLTALGTTPSPAPYVAARHCDALVAHGKSDWYLPAQEELNVLYNNRMAIGGFSTSVSTYYWNSSEAADSGAGARDFNNGTPSVHAKWDVKPIRCVRKQSPTATQVVPSGLVGHWRLDETSGTTAVDSSGAGNNATYANLAPATGTRTGMVNSSMDFRSNWNSLAETPSTAAMAAVDKFTISAWIRSEALFDAQGVFQISNIFHCFVIFSDNDLQCEARAWGTSPGAWRRNDVAVVDQWVHFAVSYDYTLPVGTAPVFYVNGIQVAHDNIASIASGAYTPPGTAVARLGSADISGLRNFEGQVDDIRLYNRVLTADEVQEIYNARDGIFYDPAVRTPKFFDGNRMVAMTRSWRDVTSGLVGHWRLDETSGTDAVDGVNGIALPAVGMAIAGATASGAVGRSLAFDGVDDYLNVNSGSVNAINGVFSGGGAVSFWYKPDASVLSNPVIMQHGSIWLIRQRAGGASESGLWFDKSYSGTSGVWRTSDTTPDISIGRWNHIVILFDSDDVANDPVAYINGTLFTIPELTAPVGTATTNDTRFSIGASISGASPTLASIDDVRLYDRFLTESEIQALYSMGAPVGSSTALPQGCPNIGNVCDDGTIYAGLSPDGNVPMFTTPVDVGTLQWADVAHPNYTSAGSVSMTTGYSNTAGNTLADGSSVAGFQRHPASSHCFALSAHGADDWFLPSRDELGVLCFNSGSIGSFSSAGGYWSSTESSTSNQFGWFQGFSTCSVGQASKGVLSYLVRCVRKGPAPRCANPYGLEGAMTYNSTFDVMQYCDGARWVAIGKVN
jgi:Concanavalin A-like lectin/glucanases superfamily